MTEVTPTLLHGRYEVMAVVGRGGEGTLVRAVDRRHGRDVALKLRRVPNDPRVTERLLIEARTLLSLHPHPGLPLARDDFFEDDRHVLVMDWVEGVDLGRGAGRARSAGAAAVDGAALAGSGRRGPHPPAHHRPAGGPRRREAGQLDAHPAGRVVLVDFGVSSTRGLRTRGGTPGYRAPEVAAGAVPTRAADVYGLAATAFALLTGEPPPGILPAWEDIDPQRAGSTRAGAAPRARHRSRPAHGDAGRARRGAAGRLGQRAVADRRVHLPRHRRRRRRPGCGKTLPDAAPGLLAEHLLVVDRAVERHGGRRIGDALQGDSTLSVFHRAGDAVRAGIDLQRALPADGCRCTAPPTRARRSPRRQLRRRHAQPRRPASARWRRRGSCSFRRRRLGSSATTCRPRSSHRSRSPSSRWLRRCRDGVRDRRHRASSSPRPCAAPVSGSGPVPRRRRCDVLRASTRGRRLPPAADRGAAPRGRRAIGLRQVVARPGWDRQPPPAGRAVGRACSTRARTRAPFWPPRWRRPADHGARHRPARGALRP